MFAGDHSDVTGYGFAVGKALWTTEKHFRGQCSDRADARVSHQPARLGPVLGLLLDQAVEIVDGALKLWIQRKQGVALMHVMWGQRQSPKCVLARWSPEGMAAAQTVAERQRLQGLLHARSDANELME